MKFSARRIRTWLRLLYLLLPATLLLPFSAAQAETITLPHQGIEVSAELQRAGDDWQQPVILMLHGTLAHSRMEIIATLQDAFAERGYSSLAINLGLALDGREGMYDCATPHRHLHQDALTEIALWLDWLQQQGAGPVVLFGHSRGGNQIARFAAEHDSPSITHVLLAAPQTWEQDRDATAYQARFNTDLATPLAQAKTLINAGRGDELLQPVDFIYCAQTAASASAFVSYYQSDADMDTPTVVQRISKPVLVIAGSADTVVDDLPERMAALLFGDRVQTITIDGADHFFLDLYAEDLADAAVDFIAGE